MSFQWNFNLINLYITISFRYDKLHSNKLTDKWEKYLDITKLYNFVSPLFLC